MSFPITKLAPNETLNAATLTPTAEMEAKSVINKLKLKLKG